jgi:hypothetical protein
MKIRLTIEWDDGMIQAIILLENLQKTIEEEIFVREGKIPTKIKIEI